MKQSKLAAVRAILVVVMLLTAPQAAHAGRTFYGWLFGDEVLPKRGAEIQTWVFEKNGRKDALGASTRETLMWWGALVGVNEKFEFVFPTEWLWREVDGSGPTFTLEKYGLEARYRFKKMDLENPDGLAPLLRLAVKRDVTARDTTIVETDFVIGYRAGKVHLLVDLGFTARIAPNGSGSKFQPELRPGAGVTFEVKEDLRLGAEGYGEINLDKDLNHERWFGVGPTLAWTHGRFWLSASFLIGVYQIDTAPRVIWGILF